MINMKQMLFISIVALFCLSAAEKQKIDLGLAVKNNAISISMLGNENSTHYYEPVLANMNNNSMDYLEINMPAGTLLEPANEAEQTLIVTEDLIVDLSPKQSKMVKVKAMCIEPWDRAGGVASIYSLKTNKNDTLIKLAKYISANKYFTSCGQNAVWTFIQRDRLAEVYGSDTIEQNNLRLFLNKLTGMPLPKPEELNNYKYNYYVPPKETLSGYFQFGLQSPHDIQVAMFDTTGILVRELFNQKQYQPSNGQKIKYEFDFTVYQNDKYFVKLIVDNEVIMTRPINAKSFRDKYKQLYEQR